jgi:hypothetical protein
MAFATREEERAYHRAWYHAHREKCTERRQAYRLANPEKVKEQNKRTKSRPSYKATCRKRRLATDWIKILWQQYGLTPADVERMFADQSGLCGSCMAELSLIRGSKNYRHVDHNHNMAKGEPGFIRGLLCGSCNRAAGLLKDSSAIARSLADYLEGH